jgi:hypothetical protein
MKESINETILKKINESNYPDSMKKFLKDILLIEIKNVGNIQQDHSNLYDSKIKTYAKTYIKDEKGEDK